MVGEEPTGKEPGRDDEHVADAFAELPDVDAAEFDDDAPAEAPDTERDEPAKADEPAEADEPADADEPAEAAEAADADQLVADQEPTDGERAPLDETDDQSDAAERLVVEPWQPPVRRHRWLARLVGVAALAIPAVIAGNVLLGASGLKEDAIDARLAGALRYDGNGDPLVRTPSADVGEVRRREWRVCGKSCDQISGRGKEFRPGEVLAGSRVQVRVIGTDGEATLDTPGWDGRLDALRRPVLQGTAQIGATVSATRGKWTGGWLGGETLVGVRACPTAKAGGRCIAFTTSTLNADGSGERTVPAAFRGWWIGAIEWHVPPGRVVRDPLTAAPETPADGRRAPTPGATVVAGPLRGPIG